MQINVSGYILIKLYLQRELINWARFGLLAVDSSDNKEFACNAGDPFNLQGREDPLEKGMATHSTIPPWRIPWAEEPDKLQSMGLQSWTRLH